MTDKDLTAWAQKLLEAVAQNQPRVCVAWCGKAADDCDCYKSGVAVGALNDAAPDLARALIASEAARKLAEERLAKAVELGKASIAEGAHAVDPAKAFDNADWFWRTMDPDDCGDTPYEAISRAMVGRFCVCEIASSYAGPTRYGFIAPVLDPESDDEEFVHFATQQEAIDAAKARAGIKEITE